MLTAHPTRHFAMQLPCHSFVDFVASERKSAHVLKITGSMNMSATDSFNHQIWPHEAMHEALSPLGRACSTGVSSLV
jgi:hypothetical protein